MKQTKYKPFDGSDEAFQLRVASNANIKAICSVFVQCHQKDDAERLYYATHGEMEPERYDEDGSAVYTFSNIYDIRTMWPALAQALFYDFPAIVEVKDGTAKIVAQEKHDKLIRSEVMRGRDDFLAGFGLNPYEARNLLTMLSSDLSFPTINRLMNPDETPGSAKPDSNTETTS